MKNPVLDLYRERATSPLEKNLLQAVDRLNGMASERQAEVSMRVPTDPIRQQAKQDIRHMLHDGQQTLKLDLLDGIRQERARIDAQLEKIGTEYAQQRERELPDRLKRLEMAKVRYQALSDAELIGQYNRYINGEMTGTDPDELDVLSGTLKQAGMDEEHQAMRNEMNARREYQPYLHQGVGREMDLLSKAYRNARPGEMPILVRDGDHVHTEVFTVEDLITGADEYA